MSTNPRAGAPLKKFVKSEVLERVRPGGLESLLEAVETHPGLGPLTDLQGDWVGKGFNIIALPDFHNKKPFRVMVNSTMEFFDFKPISAPIPNRGNIQDDITFHGLTYMQKVNDLATSETLHLEPGILLNLPANDVQKNASVVRLATIPHGNSLLAQGPSFEVAGPPIISDVDSIPFTLDNKGNRVNDAFEPYLLPYRNTPTPTGIPSSAILNPNILLKQAIKEQEAQGKKIVRTVVFQVNASPVGGINGTTPSQNNDGGIVNIPFVVKNANSNSMSAIFWIETVQNEDGSQFLQLQYTQTVILDFAVPGGNGQLVDLKWPHISVGTLIKA